MIYDVHIRKVETGEVRIHKHTDAEILHFVILLWEDGNYECDCNRHKFFDRAGGDAGSEDKFPCNTTSENRKYRVVKIVKQGKDKVLYSEES